MKIRILFSLFVFVWTGLTHAQDITPIWEVTLYGQPENAIVTLTPDGETQRIDAPDKLRDFYRPQIFLSSDNRWLAFEGSPNGNNSSTVYLSDLTTGACCASFGQGIELPDGEQPNIFEWIGFSPDNQRGAFLYVIDDPNCFEICFPKKGVVFVDLNTQKLIPAPQIMVSMGQYPVGWSQAGIIWTNGIICIEGDFCTDPLRLSSQSVQDVETGQQVSSTPIVVQPYWSDFGDHLPLTGEYISAYFFNPSDPPYDQLYAPEIIYYSPEMDRFAWKESPTPIYISKTWQNYQPDPRYYSWTRWVMDGNAILIGTSDDPTHSVLLMRDGTHQTIDIPTYRDFLAGTPDGWLMVDRFPQGVNEKSNLVNIYYYRYDTGKMSVVELAQFQSSESALTPLLIRSTPLGASVREPFVTVPQPEYQGIG